MDEEMTDVQLWEHFDRDHGISRGNRTARKRKLGD